MRTRTSQRSVLIFGGAGFIGSHWAHHLLSQSDAAVHVFDNLSRFGSEHNLRWLHRECGNSKRFHSTIGDVRDRELVRHAVGSATEIYHFAAQVAVTTSIDDPRTDFEVNAGGTFNVLEAARRSKHRPFILFTSTNKVYGDIAQTSLSSLHIKAKPKTVNESQPLDFYSPYGCSKGTADQYVRDYARIYDLPTVVFRMSCIAGPRQFGNEDQGWVAHFAYSALQDETISIYGDGTQVRDVLSVLDLVRAFDAAQKERNKSAGEVFNVGGGHSNAISLLGLLAKLEFITGKRIRRRFYSSRPGDQQVYISDFGKLQALTQWVPSRTVDDTLESICDWWVANRALVTPSSHGISPARSLTFQALPEVAS